MKKIRLHILGLAHTITSNAFSHCAFTGKVLRFSKMMISRGFEVYHYGIETSESNATVQIDVLSKDQWEKLRIASIKYLNPDISLEEIEKKLSDKKNFIGDLANITTPLYKEFNRKLRPLLVENYRSKSTDIVCLPFGRAHDDALVNLDFVYIESGIGYEHSYRDFRIFESYAILHQTMAIEKKHAHHYWFVIPNYYDILEWNLNLKPNINRVGFFGRICDVKGCNLIVEIAKRMPHIEFILCGQGNPESYLVLPNIIYKEPIEGTDRSEYLGSLSVCLAPTYYVEPFCGVNVEAQLCGTPVISNDCGAFTETIENFKTGLLAHTLEDFCQGIELAINGFFDRKYIRERAVKLYSMYNVAYKYEYAFKCLIDVFNGQNGFYSTNSWIKLLNKNYNSNSNEDLHIIKKINWFYFYTPDYEIWHNNIYQTLKVSNIFELNPIQIESIPGLNNQHHRHHFTGCFYKIELLVSCIENNIGKRIVFTDATWYINPNKLTELENEISNCKYGMTFGNNGQIGDINIGIIILDCNNTILEFWKDILEKLKGNSELHDQTLVCEKLKTFNLLDTDKFIAKSFIPVDTWNNLYRDNFIMLKIFTCSADDKKSRDDYRIDCMKKYGYFY